MCFPSESIVYLLGNDTYISWCKVGADFQKVSPSQVGKKLWSGRTCSHSHSVPELWIKPATQTRNCVKTIIRVWIRAGAGTRFTHLTEQARVEAGEFGRHVLLVHVVEFMERSSGGEAALHEVQHRHHTCGKREDRKFSSFSSQTYSSFLLLFQWTKHAHSECRNQSSADSWRQELMI